MKEKRKNISREYTQNEILSEMIECREDERNSQNQILQVVAAVGTVLALIFGASTLSGTPKNILFRLSNLVFCAAMGYCTALGIKSALRFHYLQDLEDRLFILSQPQNPQQDVIHWMSFSSPITTVNAKHLQSKYSRIHYVPYAVAVIGAILFCVLITIVQYILLDNRTTLDSFSFGFLIVFLFLSLFGFFYCTAKAKDIYAVAMKTSKGSRFKRIITYCKTNKYSNATPLSESDMPISLRTVLCSIQYYIYPRIKDLQKPLLLVIGFFSGLFFQNRLGGYPFPWRKFLLMLLILDVLVYQARFQWNDLRGLEEDAYKTNRLPMNKRHPQNAIIASIVIMFFKLTIAGVLVLLFGGDIKDQLLLCSFSIIILAILYEHQRKKNKKSSSKMGNIVLFVLVSLGYPLRFFCGFWIAFPTIIRIDISPISQLIAQISAYLHPVIILPDLEPHVLLRFVCLLLLAYSCWGCSCVILAWTQESIFMRKNNKDLVKPHYTYLYNLVKEQNDENPLGRKDNGKLEKPWNITYCISFLILFLMCFFGIIMPSITFEVILLELITIVCCFCIVHGTLEKTVWRIAYPLFIAFKTVLYFFSAVSLYLVYICLTQLLFVSVYTFLRFYFDPTWSLTSYICNCLTSMLRWFIGDEAAKQLGLEAVCHT